MSEASKIVRKFFRGYLKGVGWFVSVKLLIFKVKRHSMRILYLKSRSLIFFIKENQSYYKRNLYKSYFSFVIHLSLKKNKEEKFSSVICLHQNY